MDPEISTAVTVLDEPSVVTVKSEAMALGVSTLLENRSD